MLTIDGIMYDVKVDVRRTAEITPSDISGLMLDKSYFNDVQGTYMAYEIRLLYPLYNQDKYARLYEALTEPVDGHDFVLPYNNSTLALTARVETVEDEVLELDNGRIYWRSCRFSVIGNGPTKTMGLFGVITRGRAPLPDISEPKIGDSYTYTADGWVPATSYEDVDNTAF